MKRLKIPIFAINIGDLTKDKILAEFLISPLVPNRRIVQCEPGEIDGGAVILECPLDQALAVVSVIRIKHPQNLLRCYEGIKGHSSWKRI